MAIGGRRDLPGSTSCLRRNSIGFRAVQSRAVRECRVARPGGTPGGNGSWCRPDGLGRPANQIWGMDSVPEQFSEGELPEACRAREAHRFKSSFPVLRGLTPIKKRSALIEHAINYRKDISFSYVDAHGNRSSRVVTPFCLFQWEGEWGPAHLFKGHCHLDDAERIFRLSRMTYLKIVE
jgi:hypothetical protein